MLVKDIMHLDYPALYADDLVTKARATLREKDLRIIPVIDEKKRLLGVVSRGNVMTVTSSKSPIKVKGVMSPSYYAPTIETEASKAVREMIRLDYWYVPVVDSAQSRVYLGVLGLEDFINVFLRKSSIKLMRPVSEIMSTNIVSCSQEDEIDNVWRLMREKSIRGLPVVDKGKLSGIVTERDLLGSGSDFPTFESTKGRFKSPTKISSIMKTSVIALKKSTAVKNAAKIMVEKNFGRLPIVNDKRALIGIVDREDVAKVLL